MPADACQAQVVISEVFWSGSDLSAADEWVELRNAGTGSVSIDTWRLTSQNGQGQEQTIVQFGTGTTLGPDQHFLISNYAAGLSRLSREPDRVTTGLSLPNARLLLRLRDGTGSLIDQADDGTGVPLAGLNQNRPWGRASMERVFPYGLGDQAAAWRTAQTFMGFDDGARLYGTPGYSNGSGETADTTPPLEATGFQASAERSGTGVRLRVQWQPSASLDLAEQRMVIEPRSGSSTLVLPVTARLLELDVLTASGYALRLISVDDLGHASSGATLVVVPPDPLGTDSAIHHQEGLIRIHELISDPTGPDAEEWLELRNTGTGSETLTGYTLRIGNRSAALGSLGQTLASGSFLVLRVKDLGLSIRNSGERVELRYGATVLQSLEVPALPEGISYGSSQTGSGFQAFCTPSPGQANVTLPLDPALTLQSGTVRGEGKVTLNLQIVAGSGSLNGAQCRVDYGDGAEAESCNPPSHTVRQPGVRTVTARVTDYCGTTVERTLSIEVFPEPGGGKKAAAKKANATGVSQCRPSSDSGVTVSEVLPVPLAGGAEWIELRNKAAEQINLCGWQLDDQDGGSRPFKLDGLAIVPDGYLLLDRARTGIAVNDTGDSVRLLAPTAVRTATGTWLTASGRSVLQDLWIHGAKRGWTYAEAGSGVFRWTPIPSPGSPNLFPQPLSPTVSQAVDLVALPNPAGPDDEDAEILGIGNVSERTIDFTGWMITGAEGKGSFQLDLTQLAPGEYRWLKKRESGLSLPNERGILQLLDRNHQVVTLVTWRDAQEDARYRSRLDGERHPLDIHRVLDDGKLLVTPYRSHRSVFMPGEREAVTFYGLAASGSWMEYLSNEIQNYNYYAKKYEQLLVSNDTNQLIPVLLAPDGEVLFFRFLRLGLVTADGAVDGPLEQAALAYEALAREARVGLWADETLVRTITVEREVKALRRLRDKGEPAVRFHPEPGLLPMTGGLVRLKPSVPGALYVSVNSGAFIRSSGSLLLSEDAHMRAYVAVQAEGQEIASPVSSGSYVLRRPSYGNTLVLSEVYPAPSKKMDAALGQMNQEWVEIRNNSSEPQSLAGWVLDDEPGKGSKPWKADSSLVIPPGGYLVLRSSETRLSFSNDGDIVSLMDPNGNVDQIKYSHIGSSQSLVRESDDITCFTDVPSPGRSGGCIILKRGKDAVDTDRDGLFDDAEAYLYRTDPAHADWDRDGWPDGFEVQSGRDPQQPSTGTGILLDYQAYLLKQLKPKWYLTKTKGLVIDLRSGPIKAAWFTIPALAYRAPLVQRKSGSWEGIVRRGLQPGSYAVDLVVTDIANTKVELHNTLFIDIEENYSYAVRPKNISSQAARWTYLLPESSSAAGHSGSVLLARLQSRESGDDLQSGAGWPVATAMVLCLGAALVWHVRRGL